MSFRMPRDRSNKPFPAVCIGTPQNVNFTASSAQSAQLAVTTKLVRVVATQNCYLRFGINPTAVAGDFMLVANQPEYIRVPDSADLLRIAAIRVTADGILNITECV